MMKRIFILSTLIVVVCSAFQSVSIQKTSRISPTRRSLAQKTEIISPLKSNLITTTKNFSNNTVGSLDFSLQSKEVIVVTDTPASWFEPIAWRGVVVILCALFASNFAAAKLVMAEPGVDSSLYALTRFGVAAAALAPGAIGSLKRANMDFETIKTSIICGSWVALGYLGQTLGLLTTTASRSCVICSMHCVFVAIVAEFWRVSKSTTQSENNNFDVTRLLPAALAVAGVAIVELQGAGGAPTIGDALSFAQPIGFGMGYLTLEELMSKKPEAALPVSALKLCVVATASFLMFEAAPLFNGVSEFALQIPDFTPILSSKLALGGILYTGLVTTAFALWVESKAFAKVPATDASIILTTEPLIAALFGALTLGETFGTSDYVGASLIVGACALAALLESTANGEVECEITEDEDCEPEQNRPFWSF